jgi:hypothetical protein
MFVKGSRYETVGELEMLDENGRFHQYKKTRFIPQTTAQLVHITTAGERLDHIAYKYFRDPERFWRICDANLTMWPNDLIAEANKHILIPPSSG